MKIKIENFGPIHCFEFDLDQDFHFIFGKNNVGKSYAISAIYLLLKSLIPLSNSPFPSFSLLDEKISSIKEKVDSLALGEEIDVSLDVIDLLEEELNSSFLEILQSSFLGTYDSIEGLNNQLNQNPMGIYLHGEKINLQITAEEKRLKVKSIELHPGRVVIKKSEENREFQETKEGVCLLFQENQGGQCKENLKKFLLFLFNDLPNQVAKRIQNLYYLPASRSGLYQALSSFGQIVAELSKSRAVLKKKIELPGIAEPLSDYFLQIAEIQTQKNGQENEELNKLVLKIEESILKGSVEFDVKSKRLFFKPFHTDLQLDLSATSSMVSELSPIVSFLKFILTHLSSTKKNSGKDAKPLLIIEEPEAHLHPEVQVQMMEVFAELVKNNIKIIITSHSNYMFNKANNLILDKRIDTRKASALLFEMKEEGSIAKNLSPNSLGIEDENFVDVAEELYFEKMKLLESGEQDWENVCQER